MSFSLYFELTSFLEKVNYLGSISFSLFLVLLLLVLGMEPRPLYEVGKRSSSKLSLVQISYSVLYGGHH